MGCKLYIGTAHVFGFTVVRLQMAKTSDNTPFLADDIRREDTLILFPRKGMGTGGVIK